MITDRERIAEISKVLGSYCGFPSAAAKKLVDLGYTRPAEPLPDTDPQAERYGRLIERGWIGRKE